MMSPPLVTVLAHGGGHDWDPAPYIEEWPSSAHLLARCSSKFCGCTQLFFRWSHAHSRVGKRWE